MPNPYRSDPYRLPVAPPRNLGLRRGVLVFIAAVATVCALWACFLAVSSAMLNVLSLAGTGPADIADSFYDALEEHDYEKARSYLAPQLRDAFTVERLRTEWEQLEAGGRVVAIMESVTVENDTAHTNWLLRTDDNRSYHTSVVLEKTPDSWKITGSESQILPSP